MVGLAAQKSTLSVHPFLPRSAFAIRLMPVKAQTLTLPAAVSVVVSSMVGVGVFTSVGFQLAVLPSAFPILLLWALGGLVSLCGALCYAELAALLPRSGGEYHYLREAYPPWTGFLAGWISLTAGFAAPLAALGLAFGLYVHGLGAPAPPLLLGTLVILTVALIHLGPLRVVGGFLTATTVLKVALILAFIAGAWFAADGPAAALGPRPGDGARVGSAAFAVSMVYVLFSYSGWNGAAYVASEIRDPQRRVPQALVLGTLLVTGLYVALHAVFLRYAPWDVLSGQVEAGLLAATACFGPRGGWWMGALIAFGILSTVASYTWTGSRVTERMAQDYPGLRGLARVNRWRAPYAALGLQTGMALVMLFSGAYDAVINYLMALLQASSWLAVAAVLWLRRTRPAALRPFRVPLYPWPPLVFLAVTSWVLVYQVRARPVESAWGLLTLGAGLAVYAWARRAGPAARAP